MIHEDEISRKTIIISFLIVFNAAAFRVFSKIFEKRFLSQVPLSTFFGKAQPTINKPFGFRSGKSTIDAVVRLVMIVEGGESQRDTLRCLSQFVRSL